jgi:hypothetical protein
MHKIYGIVMPLKKYDSKWEYGIPIIVIMKVVDKWKQNKHAYL